ncbi:MAG: pre-peptidase C-terminal domain-containing protein [Gemmataceae bacterium]
MPALLVASMLAVQQLPGQKKDDKKDEIRMTAVAGMFPCGAKAGSTVTVTIGGARLTGAKAFWCEHPGITGKIKPDGASDAEVKADITVAKDVPPGLYQWRLIAKRGASAPRFLAVSSGDDLVEQEPNDSTEKAQPLAIDGAVNGNLEKYADIDIYKLTGKQGDRVLILTQCQALGVSADLATAVTDAAGRPIALGTQMFQGDPFIDYTFDRAGDVFVQVWNLVPGDMPGRVYRLTATSAPVLQFTYPAGGHRGSTVQLEVGALDPANKLGGDRQGPYSVLKVPFMIGAEAQPESAFRLPGKPTFNALEFAAGELNETLEEEPNNDPKSANAVTIPVIVNGRFPERGDVDYFKFKAEKDRKLVLDVAAQQLGYRGDLRVAIFDAEGKQLAANDGRSPTQLDPRLEFTVPADGEYTALVQEIVPRRCNGPRFIYRLAIRDPLPDFRLTLKTPTPFVKPPEGAILVNVEKLEGFDAEIALSIDGLPGDVKAAPTVVGKGANQAIIAIAAPPSRNDQHFPITIVGKAMVGDRALTRVATARVPLVKIGDEVRSSFVTDKLFLTITDEDLGPPPPPVGVGTIAASSPGWKYIAASAVKGNDWIQPKFDDGKWMAAKTPLGYGEDVVAQKKGTPLTLQGQNVYLRREFNLEDNVLKPGVKFKMFVASDDSAVVYINGKMVDNDTADHEVMYWNREVDVPANVFVKGRNVVAVQLNNKSGSSDSVFDMQLDALVPAGGAAKK